MVQDTRVRSLNGRPVRNGLYILYWMQQSQRATFNHALEYAIDLANERGLPVLAVFVLWEHHGSGTARSYAFMLEGLRDAARTLDERRIGFLIRRGDPVAIVPKLAERAATVVCDRGYLRLQVRWRQKVAEAAPCRVVQVEGDVVVPVEVASGKPEYAARTIRPKLHRVWDSYLVALDERVAKEDGRDLSPGADIDLADIPAAVRSLSVDETVPPVARFKGGTAEARARLKAFIGERLDGFSRLRNEPSAGQGSTLSPYLHFGQISPVEVALKIREAEEGTGDDRAAFLEELIVRRELAMNRAAFTPAYDRFDALPEWARGTLSEHAHDPRPAVYARSRLETADTHDRWWNAAMREMTATGYMHGYMRMYWAKKILEWSDTPESAFATVLYLNNRYFLDGRDPVSYANVAWCFGLHDRPWKERAIFGTIRFMAASGLERKFDMAAYEREVRRLVEGEQAPATP